MFSINFKVLATIRCVLAAAVAQRLPILRPEADEGL
jgi:hypothetical protein